MKVSLRQSVAPVLSKVWAKPCGTPTILRVPLLPLIMALPLMRDSARRRPGAIVAQF